MAHVEISVGKNRTAYYVSEINLVAFGTTSQVRLDNTPSQTQESALKVARGLAALAMNGGACEQRDALVSIDSTIAYEIDLAATLHQFARDVRAGNVKWSDDLFEERPNAPLKDKRWYSIINPTSSQGIYTVALDSEWHVVVVDLNGVKLEHHELRRLVTGGSREHLAHGRQAVLKAVDQLMESQSSAFWPWLAGAVLSDTAEALKAERPYDPTSPDDYELLINQGIKACGSEGWILALCGHKPLPDVPNYYEKFVAFARLWRDRKRVCRIFVEPRGGFEKDTLDTIEAHRNTPAMQALVVPWAERGRLETKFFGIAESLDAGFGFVIFHTPDSTWAVTHEGKSIDVFAHSRLWPPFNLRALVELFEGLCTYADDWPQIQEAVMKSVDPIKKALWMNMRSR